MELPVRSVHAAVLEGPDTSQEKGSADSLSVGTASGNDLVLTDTSVSRYHLEVTRKPNGFLLVDCGSTNGTFVGPVRVERAIIPPGTVVKIGRSTVRFGDGESATVEMHRQNQLGELRGTSPVMRRLMAQIERAARTRSSVLLVGESGTGKELIARAIHEAESPDRDRPMVTVDCGALSSSLVASELFGHERGAFTGADRQYAGAFERATGGTLFLDEIGELPVDLQSNLLGALERRRFRRVGGRQEINVDIRVLGATNRDLRAEVNAGKFRLDLYYRLSVITLKVPPLRDRPEDLPLLIEGFLRETGCDDPLTNYFSPEKMAELSAYFWPGNVRELRNLVEATVALGESPALVNAQAAPRDAGSAPAGAGVDLGDDRRSYREARAAVLRDFEAPFLRRLFDRCKGNVSQAAREARMDRSHLITLLARHNIH
jgi:DNA-binding NtrC family response regulator